MVAAVPEMQAATNQKQCFDMLIVRLMHIADMPPISEMIKQEKTSAPVAPVQKAEQKKVEIKTATDLANALSNAREMLMYSYFTKNIEVSEIVNNKIAYFDRGDDADFQKKLIVWLNTNTGANWTLEKIEQSAQQQTVGEQEKIAVESDPMVADAMSLFENAEIVGVSKQ
jgi:hypothetical protein